MYSHRGKPLNAEDKAEKTDVKKRLFYALLVVALVTFGIASFFLGWNIYFYLDDFIGCAPPPTGGCIAEHIPQYIVGLAFITEIAASAFVGLTLYKIIHQKDARIQELKNMLEKPAIFE